MKPSDYISVEPKQTKFFIDGFKQSTIEIDNSFQRRDVWVEKDKIALIESIIKGYPIPELYLWETGTSPEDGESTYSIVDGQQRISSIWDFTNNKFPLKKSAIDFKDDEYSGKYFHELTSEIKKDFWSYKFQVRIIKDTFNRERINELFLRLNSTSTSLNPQELRNAKFNGKFIQLADKISDLEFWNNFEIFTKQDYRRMVDIQIISMLLMFLRQGIEDTTQTAINKIYDEYNDVYEEADEDFDIFKSILKILSEVIDEQNELQNIVKTKVHFYSLFILSYYILTSEYKSEIKEIAPLLNEWFIAYKNKNYSSEGKFAELEEYAILSQEGSGKKYNRNRRFEILKKYIKNT